MRMRCEEYLPLATYVSRYVCIMYLGIAPTFSPKLLEPSLSEIKPMNHDVHWGFTYLTLHC